jgi:glucosamine kinase
MILLAESGSTKTDWRMIADSGAISQAKTIGFNPYYQDSEAIFQEIQTNLLPHIQATVTEIHYYGTGVTNAEKGDVIKVALQKTFPQATDIQAYSDMVAAARALCGHQEGIACILGTGSNSCFYDGQTIAHQVPPLGFWLGDEGSGGHLGKLLLLSYLHKELPDDLREKFEKRYGAKDRLEILDNAYHQPFPNRYFAGFSKFLFDNRRHPFVYRLVYEAFLSFFEKYILKYPQIATQRVHFTGSIAFYYSDILRQAGNDKGIAIGNILESPIAGLTLYHKSELEIRN